MENGIGDGGKENKNNNSKNSVFTHRVCSFVCASTVCLLFSPFCLSLYFGASAVSSVFVFQTLLQGTGAALPLLQGTVACLPPLQG